MIRHARPSVKGDQRLHGCRLAGGARDRPLASAPERKESSK